MSDKKDKTLDKIQEDISGSQQVDSDGNQNQATNQKLSTQDNDVISPQASKDNSLPGLSTPDFTLGFTLKQTPGQYPEQTIEQTTKQTTEQTLKQTPEPIQEPTPARPSGPLIQRTMC